MSEWLWQHPWAVILLVLGSCAAFVVALVLGTWMIFQLDDGKEDRRGSR